VNIFITVCFFCDRVYDIHMCIYGFMLTGAFGGAAQALGSAIEAPAGERSETATGSEADTVHAGM